jgi:phage pi2 protein 07
MFHSMLLNYKLLSADHKCIYSEYKIYVEKYWKMKQLFHKLKIENKQIRKELVRLQQELDRKYEEDDMGNKNCTNDSRYQIYVVENYVDEVVEQDDDGVSLDTEEVFELV